MLKQGSLFTRRSHMHARADGYNQIHPAGRAELTCLPSILPSCLHQHRGLGTCHDWKIKRISLLWALISCLLKARCSLLTDASAPLTDSGSYLGIPTSGNSAPLSRRAPLCHYGPIPSVLECTSPPVLTPQASSRMQTCNPLAGSRPSRPCIFILYQNTKNTYAGRCPKSISQAE
ncbi:hypothetical protein LZ30DRAFT_196248 [Colletotrichum cereale]|nr:hypothetical protein LZ30DRAFT_196248 [Colletotrichum cereale]